MIRLYLSQDLVKAGPRAGNPGGGSRAGASSAGSPGGGARTGNPGGGARTPKTPAAATGGSGPQIVDCPLGAACPNGGRHESTSSKLKDHTAQAAAAMQSKQTPGDESKGEDPGKPGVPPGAANIGGVGSDQAEVRQPPSVPGDEEHQTVDTGEFHTETVDPGQEDPKGHVDFSAKEFEKDPNNAKTRSMLQGTVTDQAGVNQPVTPQKPPMGSQVAGTNMDRPGMETKEVPNPLAGDESAVPPDSKPMDHYKLSQVAKESGDDELASFHEGMARKRTDGMGSEDHKKLADDLTKEGMHEQAAYHAGIHSRVNGDSDASVPFMITKDQHQQLADLGYSKEARNKMTPQQAQDALGGKKHESSMRDVHHEARTKAKSDLESAKKTHEETKAKADKIRQANEEKTKKYESDKSEYEKKKEAAKNAKDKSTVPRVGKPPQKPKLDKEEKVADKPELYEPENDADKLRHEGHTDKAKRVAELAESHLKGNKNLSSEQRSRLERAHKMAVYHSNIDYTPTAAHKKELGDVESAISGMGIKQSHEEMAAAEDAKKTAVASKQAEKDNAAAAKQKASEEKQSAKQQAANEKQQAADAKSQPRPPETELDQARMGDHKTKAQELRANIEAHLQSNPNMSPEAKAKAESILSELDKHDGIDMVPGSAHESELKELQKLAGEHGKPYKAESDGEGGGAPGGGNDPGHNYAYNMLNQGRALGAVAAASATNPYGQAGQLGSAVPAYGVSGATSAGHHLLKDDTSPRSGAPEVPAEKPARPQQSSLRSSEE